MGGDTKEAGGGEEANRSAEAGAQGSGSQAKGSGMLRNGAAPETSIGGEDPIYSRHLPNQCRIKIEFDAFLASWASQATGDVFRGNHVAPNAARGQTVFIPELWHVQFQIITHAAFSTSARD